MQATINPVIFAAVAYIVGMATLIGAFAVRKIKVYPVANPAWYQTQWARIFFVVALAVIGLCFIATQSGVLTDMKQHPAPTHTVAPSHGRGR